MSSLVIATSILNNTANKYLTTNLSKRIISSTISIFNSKQDNNCNHKKIFYSTKTNTAAKYNYEQNTKDSSIQDKENIEITSNQNNDSTNWFPNKVLVNNDDNNRNKILNSDKNINNKNTNNDPNRRPTNEQLIKVKEQLIDHLPKFLQKTHPYSLYTPDVVFENFYKEPGKITVGVLQYAIQLTMLRWKIHWKFSYAKLEILKITHEEKDGTIKIRWRINGIRGMKSMIQPWKIKAWQVKESVKNESEWHDGFSVLYLRGDGLIYKHRLQRVISNNEEDVENDKKKNFKIATNLDVGPTMCV